MKKVFFSGLAVLLLILNAVFMGFGAEPASAAPAKPSSEKVKLVFGSTRSSSGFYVFSAAVDRVVNKYASGISMTTVESGASYDNVRKIREGVFNGGSSEGMQASYEMYRGLESFKGKAWEPIRFLFMREMTGNRIYVRADSSFKTWSDLAGKRLYPGNPGSASAVRAQRCNDLLGTEIKLIPGMLPDALRDLQTGKLEAVWKSSPLRNFDAAMIAVHHSTPLRVIGFTAEEAAKINAKYPQFLVMETPANSIKILEKNDSFWDIKAIAGAHSSSRLSQDVGYRIVKAIYEHWNEIKTAYPPATDDPIADYVKIVPPGLEVPLHAGTIQYAKEIGITIPKHFIPPEYKP